MHVLYTHGYSNLFLYSIFIVHYNLDWTSFILFRVISMLCNDLYAIFFPL